MTAPMQFRPAHDGDCLDLLAWRNDPACVAASLSAGPVAEADHRAWFARVLADPARILLIAEQDAAKLGMVRFDLGESGEWEVSINLASEERGKGLARAMLAQAIGHAFPPDYVRPDLIARVKRENVASWRLFLGCGFILAGEGDGVGHFRLLGRNAESAHAEAVNP